MSSSAEGLLSLEEVCNEIGVNAAHSELAAVRLANAAHCTPVLTSRLLDVELSGGATSFFFKAEALQRTGSFKFRGAYNALAAHQERDAAAAAGPVVTHSSGNHGAALAAAAALHGRRAHVVMPHGAPRVKLAAVEAYGAAVVRCEPTLADRERTMRSVSAATGAMQVHPFLDPDVVAGQGTIALEFLQQVDALDALVVPVGGGGMISGIAVVAKTIYPQIRLIGAEPLAADDAARSLTAGAHLKPAEAPVTIADGLKATLGSVGWCVVRNLVETVVTVTEAEIAAATRLVWERMKIVVEPSAGVGVAAVQTELFRSLGLKRVGVVLCGGNVDLDELPWLSSTGKSLTGKSGNG